MQPFQNVEKGIDRVNIVLGRRDFYEESPHFQKTKEVQLWVCVTVRHIMCMKTNLFIAPQSVYTDNFSEDPLAWTDTHMMMPPPPQQLTPPDSHANSDPTTSPVFDISPASKSGKSDQSIQCWHCNKTFTRQDNLRRHTRKMHEQEHVPSAEFAESQW